MRMTDCALIVYRRVWEVDNTIMSRRIVCGKAKCLWQMEAWEWNFRLCCAPHLKMILMQYPCHFWTRTWGWEGFYYTIIGWEKKGSPTSRVQISARWQNCEPWLAFFFLHLNISRFSASCIFLSLVVGHLTYSDNRSYARCSKIEYNRPLHSITDWDTSVHQHIEFIRKSLLYQASQIPNRQKPMETSVSLIRFS